MKKLILAMGCLAAMIVMNSCTTDDVESTTTATTKSQEVSAIGGDKDPRP